MALLLLIFPLCRWWDSSPGEFKGGGMGMIEEQEKGNLVPPHLPKPLTEFPHPNPHPPKTLLSSHPSVLLNQQISPPSFQPLPLLDQLAPLRPYQTLNAACTNSELGFLPTKTISWFHSLHIFYGGVCGVPDPLRGPWVVAKFKHTWTLNSEHSSVGQWTARTNWSVHNLGDSRYCSDQSSKGNKTPGEGLSLEVILELRHRW